MVDRANILKHSSPLRGQGTLAPSSVPLRLCRFTPARAGNTSSLSDPRSPQSVHPCAGREHSPAMQGTDIYDGSPLRGQGTPRGMAFPMAPERFTPARAGNTMSVDPEPRKGSVHPCAGREHLYRVNVRMLDHGSPLRGQGTHVVEAGLLAPYRFTPARAGNT